MIKLKMRQWIALFAIAILLIFLRIIWANYHPMKSFLSWRKRRLHHDDYLRTLGISDDYSKQLALQPGEDKNMSLGAAMMLVHPNLTRFRGRKRCFFNQSMDRLVQYWQPRNPYPLHLMTNRPWRHDEIVEIKSNWPSLNLSFLDVSLYFPEFESAEDYFDQRTAKFSNHYRHMCAFFFYRFLTHPILRKYRYLMRIDEDACIEHNIEVDLFQDLSTSNASYAYITIFSDSSNVVRGLYDFVNTFKQKYGISWSNPELASTNSRWHAKRRRLLAFATNWEIIDTVRYRQPDILRFLQAIHHSMMIYQQRWGDAPLRFLLATLFWNHQEVQKICDFSYQHGNQESFMKCNRSNHDNPVMKEDVPMLS
jgi:hypothetical protein